MNSNNETNSCHSPNPKFSLQENNTYYHLRTHSKRSMSDVSDNDAVTYRPRQNSEDGSTNTFSNRKTTIANVMLLSCMDFNFMTNIVEKLNNLGYKYNYNNFTLAGSSLGYNNSEKLQWRQSFHDHAELSIKLHNIQEIFIIDHMDCCSYKLHYGIENCLRCEPDLHKEQLYTCIQRLKVRFPKLKYKAFIVNLDGNLFELHR